MYWRGHRCLPPWRTWHSELGIQFNRMRRSLDYDRERNQTDYKISIAAVSFRVAPGGLLPDSVDRYSGLFFPSLAGLFRCGNPADRSHSIGTNAIPTKVGSAGSRVSEPRRTTRICTVANLLLLAKKNPWTLPRIRDHRQCLAARSALQSHSPQWP